MTLLVILQTLTLSIEYLLKPLVLSTYSNPKCLTLACSIQDLEIPT